jgi:hypothetical protein
MIALDASGLLDHLRVFDPVLVGTVPLDIDIAGSDLDILCHAPRRDELAAVLIQTYANLPGFTLSRDRSGNCEAIIARFQALSVPIEIFATARPVEEQEGFRHLNVEYRLLQFGGAVLREQVRQLKRAGMRTEPAFARLLELPGDPYEALLGLEDLPDDALCGLVRDGSTPTG